MSIERFIRKEEFYHHFQPIYRMGDWKISGYEALLRSEVHSNPEHTFAAAKKMKQLYELDSRSIHKAISTYQAAGLSRKGRNLFVNVYPSTIANPNFPSFLNQIISENHVASQIIFEISEKEIANDSKDFKAHFAKIRELGFLIAIDDVGKGYANFQSVIELEPDYLKLDQYFSKQLNLHKQKQTFIRHLLNYCNDSNIEFILEGIEEDVELAIAKYLGVPYAQGYILGKPSLLQKTV